jgi:hypothetical protein
MSLSGSATIDNAQTGRDVPLTCRRVSGLIKIWIEAGSLVVVEEKDDHRELKKFVKVAEEEDEGARHRGT